MIRTDCLYETCRQLFADYPLAAEDIGGSGLIRSMALMLPEGDKVSFFMLVAWQAERRAFFSLFPWHADGGVDIKPDGEAVPQAMVAALTSGIPIPRDGSMFGWAREGIITALIGVQARYTPASPLPSWTVLPLASIPAAQWPPFTGDHLLGPWFWEHYRAGTIVLLNDLIAGTAGLVFWVDTKRLLGSGCCVVAGGIESADGYTLPRGCYVYYEALRTGRTVPSPDLLLANLGKTDLGPHFQHARANRQRATG
ncbi:MAG TPA: hypothetical protein VMH35_18605 [Streptosporangiaceae bacterium]|nr:hypothetical protein [Streptosporangiaceae bacterium]